MWTWLAATAPTAAASARPNIDAPGGTLTVCAKIAKADLSKVPGGSKDVHVANVTVKVVPRACP